MLLDHLGQRTCREFQYSIYDEDYIYFLGHSEEAHQKEFA